MKQTRREFLRGAVGWGGLLLAGSLELAVARRAEPLRRAHRYLAMLQSADGAWRAGSHAAFRGGDALTPVVLWAMQRGSRSGFQQLSSSNEKPAARSTRASFELGWKWLCDLTDRLRDRDEPWSELSYPLFTASYSAQVFARCGDSDRAGTWVKIIRSLRTGEELGWPADSPMCGAWSDASRPPRYVSPVPDMLAPNISATALAASALAVAGCAAVASTARRFIEHCQNFAEESPTPFDDGGFFFALDDPIRNKAGSAGRDPHGPERFRSYGSATCDGWLAWRALGVSTAHPRLRAATAWLRNHLEGFDSAGDWPASRAEARASLAFYLAQALATVLVDLPAHDQWSHTLRKKLLDILLARQGDDGSWQGLAPDSCEDEPLLASAFAVRALSLLG